MRFDDLATGEVWEKAVWENYVSGYSDTDAIEYNSSTERNEICGRNASTGALETDGRTTAFTEAIAHPDAPTNTKVVYHIQDVPTAYKDAAAQSTYSGTVRTQAQAETEGWFAEEVA